VKYLLENVHLEDGERDESTIVSWILGRMVVKISWIELPQDHV